MSNYPQITYKGKQYHVVHQTPTSNPNVDKCILLKVGGISLTHDRLEVELEVTW